LLAAIGIIPMNTIKQSLQSLINLKRQAFFVIFICYIPHIASEPTWLFIIFLAAIGYQLTADYFRYPPLPAWMRFILFIACLFLLYLNGDIFSSGFFIRCLLTFIILKFLEIRNVRDLKVIVLCNFFLIFAALIVIQDLWINIYLFIAVIANLSIMLKLSASEATLRQIGSKSGQQLLIAIPLSILLFYFFPRIDPLWKVPSISTGNTGFSDTMSPGSVAAVFNDSSPVMQITFKNTPIVDGYWRGIVLSFYNGESWNSAWYNYSSFVSLPELKANENADYEIILEPHQKKWLFYEGYPVAGASSLLFSPDHGLIRQNKEPVTQRLAYSIKVQTAPYEDLDSTEYAAATQFPRDINPRLNAWAKKQFANSHRDIKTFISFLHDYIYQQSFWYTQTPPPLGADKNQMDVFWFDTQKGFCEHYASAVTLILRSAGIPARVILGYHGGLWNPISSAITIERSDAHAWVEYWQQGSGWQQLDPTSFIASERIDQTIRNRELSLNQENTSPISALSWGRRIGFYFESAQFFYERWFLFYNQNSQQSLLKNAGLGKWKKGELLQASVGCMILFFILIELFYQWRQKRALDALLLEYHLLQKEFRKFKISTHPSATLKQQCKSLIKQAPALAPILSNFIFRYEQLRLKHSKTDVRNNKKETIALFKTLRHTLRRRR
jgi:transglutaminase-like putative cysteine protease